MQHKIVRALNKVKPCMWKLDSPVLSLEDEEHEFEFEKWEKKSEREKKKKKVREKEWKLVEMLENGDAWHVIRMLGEKKDCLS